MSGFINKTYSNTIDSLTKGMIDKVKSANYVYNNKPPVIGDWYNQDIDTTTLDEGTGAEYVSIGKNSPIRFNLIEDAVFYAQNIQIEIDLEYDEDGLTSAPPAISGIVLPNTWIPYSGDYFTLKQVGKDYIYRVESVSYDTIDNNNNVYKFEARIDKAGKSYIDKQVVNKYKMVINNVGTSFKAVIKESDYNCIDTLDQILVTLKNYFIALFYRDAIQTFTYKGFYGNLYDPYMIEFLSRNNILAGSKEYVYVHHEVPVPRTFSIEYNNSPFRALETKNISGFSNNSCIGELINNQYTLFATVIEDYFMIKYKDQGLSLFNPIDSLLISGVKTKEKLPITDQKAYYNIIIDYFNDGKIDSSIVPILESIEFKDTADLFYGIPMLIFVLESGIKKLMT